MAVHMYPPPYAPPYPTYGSQRKPSPPSSILSRSHTLNVLPLRPRNRSLSVRSHKSSKDTSSSHTTSSVPKHRFTMASLRGIQQPELSKRLFKLIKSENYVIGAYENVSRERISIASQLSEWGEATGDDAVSDISDKLGVLLSEIGEQENGFGENLEEYRAVLKQIRNTESSVQPSRDHKAKIADEIGKLKYKDPQNTKIAQLEQELVRAEAENLVAEAQLTNMTRTKLKEAYDIHFAAVVERAEKQILMAKHGRRLLNLLDDTPVVPGDARPAFQNAHDARVILNEAEEDLRGWSPNLEPIHSSANAVESNLMPAAASSVATGSPPRAGSRSTSGTRAISGSNVPMPNEAQYAIEDSTHPAHRKGSPPRTAGASAQPPYPEHAEEAPAVAF